MKTIMVVGATGVLGKLVYKELLRVFEDQIKLSVTDYKPENEFMPVLILKTHLITGNSCS
ncbi:hypothetical protein [Ureibacillus sp. GCM10028918]|uniref:hypothetical protein n=1 Tax=Ureibacillus sp. GCM10028918 TaxID=3273429 RepID=UPI0036F311C7